MRVQALARNSFSKPLPLPCSSLDHTAEVLENYRRIQENKIFNHLLMDERNKKAFLRKESRKTENLVAASGDKQLLPKVDDFLEVELLREGKETNYDKKPRNEF